MAKKLEKGTDVHEKARLNDANSPTVAFGHVSSIRGSPARPHVCTRYRVLMQLPSSRGPAGPNQGSTPAGVLAISSLDWTRAFSVGTVAEGPSFFSLHGPDSLLLERNAGSESGTGRKAFYARPASHALVADEVATRFATDATLELWLISNRSSIPSSPVVSGALLEG